jgi:hypothetical protein
VDEDDTDLTSAGHRGVRRYSPNRLLINLMRLKRAAMVKTADFTLMTAEFGGERITFQPWLTLRVVRRDRIVSCGVYQQAFPRDESEAGPLLPDVAWRRTEWDRARDVERIDATPDKGAYLVGDEQVDSQVRFGRLADQPRLAAVLQESIEALAGGVRVVGLARPDAEWEQLRVSVLADELALTVEYAPWLAQSDAVESWAEVWLSLFESLDDTGVVAPDGDVIASYDDSFAELVAQVRRFPQPVVGSLRPR